MIVKKYEFIGRDDYSDISFKNWSRCYEWGYALKTISNLAKPVKIHNTCCGHTQIHKQFHDALLPMSFDIVNSDLFKRDLNPSFINFREYNILDPLNELFDVVLCVSTFEELPRNEGVWDKAFKNLVHQVKKGGRLIITCDYPDVDLNILDSIIGQKCSDTKVRLNGSNSILPQPEFAGLNVVLIDLEI